MSDDAMVPIAHILGRGEALTVAAMLDSAGIIVHVGGEYYGGVTLNIIAMGGYRLTVPVSQQAEASAILQDYVDQPSAFIPELRRRTLRILAVVCLTLSVPGAWIYVQGGGGVIGMTLSFLFPLGTTPASPQGRSAYYLSAPDGD